METLLSHYFQPDNPADVQDAALLDWVRELDGCSQPAIDAACRSYLREEPRRRPTPGDILARSQSHDQARAKRDIRAGAGALSDDEALVVEWAVKTNRLSSYDARQAVIAARSMVFPSWLPEVETQRGVYAVRKHPAHMEPVA